MGIIVNNSGGDPNEIYNNHFSHIGYGIIAQNLNRNTSDTTGLCIKCNDFYTTIYDIIINQAGNNPNWGIARNQGWKLLQTDPAGNTFSKNHSSSIPYADINNQASLINYYHHAPHQLWRVRPDFSDVNMVVKKPTTWPYIKSSVCPSKISTGGGSISMDNLLEQLSHEQQAIDSLSTTLDLLTDGGSTGDLNSAIEASTPSKALELRQELLSNSPYLSDTVMQSAIQKENVLPNVMIRDLLVANPQSAKSDVVMNQLNDRVVSMPDSMMAEIQEGAEIISLKDSLGAALYNHQLSKSGIFNDLVSYYKNDSVSPSAAQDSTISLLQRYGSINSRYWLAFEYLKINDTLNVRNTLTRIPIDFNLDKSQQSIYQDYLSYFAVMTSLKSEGRTIFEMNPQQTATIRGLMANGDGQVQTLSINILIANNFLTYVEPILLPDNTKSSKQRIRYPKTGKINNKSFIKIFPNPAKQYVILEYNLKDKFQSGQSAIISIATLDGKHVETFQLGKQQDQILLSTTTYSSGTYICTLLLSGKHFETQKFTIIQ